MPNVKKYVSPDKRKRRIKKIKEEVIGCIVIAAFILISGFAIGFVEAL